jgi:hypothetical protein
MHSSGQESGNNTPKPKSLKSAIDVGELHIALMTADTRMQLATIVAEYLSLHHVGGSNTPPIKVPVTINGVDHSLELDTGAAVTIMSEGKCKQLFPDMILRQSSILLRTYSGERIPVIGELDVDVQ